MDWDLPGRQPHSTHPIHLKKAYPNTKGISTDSLVMMRRVLGIMD